MDASGITSKAAQRPRYKTTEVAVSFYVSIGDVIQRTRRFANAIVVVVGRSTDGTGEIAAERGASVLNDGGRGKGEAIRCAITR